MFVAGMRSSWSLISSLTRALLTDHSLYLGPSQQLVQVTLRTEDRSGSERSSSAELEVCAVRALQQDHRIIVSRASSLTWEGEAVSWQISKVQNITRNRYGIGVLVWRFLMLLL